jgi:cyclopropane fatty-acyl-phospholipid synthase-like methyltransferase
MRNFSESCQRNQEAILTTLSPWLRKSISLLEIGSGSGQHAIHFCARFPQLHWQCTDRGNWLADLGLNLAETQLANLPPPLELDVNRAWPLEKYDIIYTANSLHIMSWDSVKALFSQLSEHLTQEGIFCCYGPFKYQNEFTSPSNANFEAWLQSRDRLSGVRDFEAVAQLAKEHYLDFMTDHLMPANNQLLIWQKR